MVTGGIEGDLREEDMVFHRLGKRSDIWLFIEEFPSLTLQIPPNAAGHGRKGPPQRPAGHVTACWLGTRDICYRYWLLLVRDGLGRAGMQTTRYVDTVSQSPSPRFGMLDSKYRCESGLEIDDNLPIPKLLQHPPLTQKPPR
jgi:hypothetical protein